MGAGLTVVHSVGLMALASRCSVRRRTDTTDAMAASERRVWTVGSLSRDGSDDADWVVGKARELGEDEFADLENKVAFVADLASQEEYGRLLTTVARFDALLKVAEGELETNRQLSPRSVTALPLDLAAVIEAAQRLEVVLAANVDAASDLPTQLVTYFHDVRQHIRASGFYLIAHEISRRAVGGELSVVLRDGAVHFEGGSRYSAREVATGVLGTLFSLVGAYLNLPRSL
jgi:hypothetical protein